MKCVGVCWRERVKRSKTAHFSCATKSNRNLTFLLSKKANRKRSYNQKKNWILVGADCLLECVRSVTHVYSQFLPYFPLLNQLGTFALFKQGILHKSLNLSLPTLKTLEKKICELISYLHAQTCATAGFFKCIFNFSNRK